MLMILIYQSLVHFHKYHGSDAKCEFCMSSFLQCAITVVPTFMFGFDLGKCCFRSVVCSSKGSQNSNLERIFPASFVPSGI